MEILRAVVARHHAEKEASLNVGSTVESDEGNDILNSSIPSIVDEGEARVQTLRLQKFAQKKYPDSGIASLLAEVKTRF